MIFFMIRRAHSFKTSVYNYEKPHESFDNNRSITADGQYVGYDSDASKLVGEDTKDARDVLVRDCGEEIISS